MADVNIASQDKTPAELILHRKPYSEEDTDMMFEQLLVGDRYFKTGDEKALVRRAYAMARDVYHGQKRHTGDSFIYHLFDVMSIVVQDIGLDAIGAAAALLHEITFQTDYKKEDIAAIFGDKIAVIVDSLVRIKGTSEYFKDSDPKVYENMIYGLTGDFRVILIKFADRLTNLRTLEVRSPESQYKVAYETMEIYVRLAHRIGLNKIKTELETLAFKYLNRKEYDEINSLMQLSENESKNYINKFSLPIIAKLVQNGIKFDVKGRPKSIYSIYQKMKKKHVTFDEVYDKFAIRIIFTPSDPSKEKEECMKIVELIKQDYFPHPERTRDWVTVPKENGYEAYHLTVFDEEKQRWVEIQIRSERMDEIAEYGFAAHWKYKGIKDKKEEFGDKLKLLKEKLEDPSNTNFDFMENFRLLLSDEISVYSPDGAVTTLPAGATVLDYAYINDPDKARNCIGAKVNHKMMSRSTLLHSGDQVEVVTSKYTEPKPEWVNMVITNEAYTALSRQLQNYMKVDIAEGQNILHNIFAKYKIRNESEVTTALMSEFGCLNKTELYQKISKQNIPLADVDSYVKKSVGNTIVRFWKLQFGGGSKNDDSEGDSDSVNYELAGCCNPMPGDETIGIMAEDKSCIFIHKKDCLYAATKIKERPLSLIPVSWKTFKEQSSVAKITMEGMDQKGIALRIITVVSQEFDLNLKTVNIETDGSSFSCTLEVYVRNQDHLEKLVNKLSCLNGIMNIVVEGEEIY